MCLTNVYYPLVEIDSLNKFGKPKKKILFDYPYEVHTREDYLFIKNFDRELILGFYGYSDKQYINRLIKLKNEMDIKFLKLQQVPCGHCSECLNMISRAWAFRILKEAELHEENYFITFTYDNNNLPLNHMLVVDEISKFNKKLKIYLNRKGLKSDFRFYGVGEYGSHTYRPHYHVIYFGLPIPDLVFQYRDKSGNLHFSSSFIKSIWSKGLIDIGSVDVGSACYVARYCDKKMRLTKNEKDDLISKGVVPEFSRMSRRPGIGADFLEEAIEEFKKGKTSYLVNHNYFSLPLYYSNKIKNILPDNILESYQIEASKRRNSFISDIIAFSDNIDIFDYMKEKNHFTERQTKL